MTKKLSGQVTVTTAGTAVQETGAPNGRYFLIRALAGNSGVVYVGNDGAGDVTSGNGHELSAGDQITVDLEGMGDLAFSDLWFDAANNGDKLSWLLIG